MSIRNCVYLDVAELNEDLVTPIETYIVLFISYYCDVQNTEIHLVLTNESTALLRVPRNTLNWKISKIVSKEDLPQEIRECSLPAVQSSDRKVHVGGLCAVIRWIVKTEVQKFPSIDFAHLLGFRKGCLMACSEVSIWTKFCEIDLPTATTNFLIDCSQANSNSTMTVPEELLRLESHLAQPVKTHNILKRKQDILGKKGTTDSTNAVVHFKTKPCCKDDVYGDLEHTFAEGVDMTLADLVLFPCAHILMTKLKQILGCAEDKVPLVTRWYKRLLSDKRIADMLLTTCNMLAFANEELNIPIKADILIPQLESMSLYIRDPIRKKVKVRNRDPSALITKVQSIISHPLYKSNSLDESQPINWSTLPSAAHPAGGDLPASRVTRKCQQLQNIISAVLSLNPIKCTIVDFCSGSGHCGILLAYLLPDCKVILIENKEPSMDRARKRVSELHLDNVCFYQCNLDYFQGRFDIGVSLHACGVSTDLVIDKCMKNGASFVCCPCCYGSIHNNHVLKYPRSEKFRATGITYDEYLVLCHCADRTEFAIKKAEQGKLCMGLIDTDRSFSIWEAGYKVVLYTMSPPSCSPKNNLLVGYPDKTIL